MDINLEYYKIFYYVAGSQSITLAAEHLPLLGQPHALGRPHKQWARKRLF